MAWEFSDKASTGNQQDIGIQANVKTFESSTVGDKSLDSEGIEIG